MGGKGVDYAEMLEDAWAPAESAVLCGRRTPQADCRGCRKVQALK